MESWLWARLAQECHYARFREEQIIALLKEAKAGAKVPDLCRKHGISDATFHKWEAKYGAWTVDDLRRPKELEVENAKLKRAVADRRRLTRP